MSISAATVAEPPDASTEESGQLVRTGRIRYAVTGSIARARSCLAREIPAGAAVCLDSGVVGRMELVG